MKAQIFKPEPNKHYTIALKYVVGQLVNGAWGMQLLWFLSDGRRMYTPRIFQKFVDEAGIKPGQVFSFRKAVEGRKTVWKVSRVQQGVVDALNGSGPLDSPIPGDEPDEDPPPIPLTRLEHALKTAVHAAAKAEKHAESLGYACRFSSSDVRAMAISVLIGMDRRAA